MTARDVRRNNEEKGGEARAQRAQKKGRRLATAAPQNKERDQITDTSRS
jgi:hypothetical protein